MSKPQNSIGRQTLSLHDLLTTDSSKISLSPDSTLFVPLDDESNIDSDETLPFLLDETVSGDTLPFDLFMEEEPQAQPVQKKKNKQLIDSRLQKDNTTKLKILGEGGMGRVFLGKQEYPSREVAIKELKEQSTQKGKLLLREAMITGKIPHPNIIPIHELKLTNQGPEIIMQRVDGHSFEHFLDRKPQKGTQLLYCIDILKDVCNALIYAHDKGVFHRDIKPENIMLGHYGEIYVLDWGIALDTKMPLSNRKVIVGSPAYMAPEMLTGYEKDVSVQSDIYLLGSTLHEILVGSPRHIGNTLQDVFDSVQRSEPYEYPSSIFEKLGVLCNKACHVDPAQRHISVREFQQELSECIVHWDAIKLCNKAQETLDHLQITLQQMEMIFADSDKSITNFSHVLGMSLTNHEEIIDNSNKYFIQARFGFEQALLLWPECEIAHEGIKKTLLTMFDISVCKGQYDNTLSVYEDLQKYPLDDETKVYCKNILEKLQKNQNKLQRLIESQDTSLTQPSRKVLGYSIAVVSLLLVMILYLHNKFIDPELSAKRFVYVILIADVPLIGLALYYRRVLFSNAIGQLAFFTILGGLSGLTANRFIGWQFDSDPKSILVIDTFILGVAVLNSTPVLPSGIYLALCSAVLGCLSLFFPQLAFDLHLLSIAVVAIGIALDWSRR